MKQHEVDKILGEAESKEAKPKLKIDFRPGESVKIKVVAGKEFRLESIEIENEGAGNKVSGTR